MNTLQQTFQVPYTYSIFFTKRLFDPANATLRSFFESFGQAGFQRKVLLAIDGGFLAHHPTLQNEMVAYFASLEPLVKLVPQLLVLPGGEAAKNDTTLFDDIVEAIDN